MASPAVGPAVEVDDVSRTFRSKSGPVDALTNVSFAVPAGQVLGLLGENGAGKTTMLKILATLLVPTTGTARVCGIDVVRDPKAVRSASSVVFGGEHGLYTRLSGRDNVRFFATIGGVRGPGTDHRIASALERVGLSDVRDRPVETYSRGMRQRLHIAIGTITRPRVLLLDEPTIGLDPAEAQRLRDTVKEFAGSGVTVVLTSHNLVDIEALADRVCLLREGIVTHDAPLAGFMRLTDRAGIITIVGRGPAPPTTPPMASIGDIESIHHSNDQWTLRLAVHAWSTDLFASLAALSALAEIIEFSIEPVGIEHVYAEVLRQVTSAAAGSAPG